MKEPKFDAEIALDLSGPDGNAFAVMGHASRAMKDAGATQGDVASYHAEATSGDYEHLLAVTREYVGLVEL